MSSVLEENDKICGRDARSISLEAARASGEGSQDLVDNAFSAAVAGKKREEAVVPESCDMELSEQEAADVEAEHEEEANVVESPSVTDEPHGAREPPEEAQWKRQEAGRAAATYAELRMCVEGGTVQKEDEEVVQSMSDPLQPHDPLFKAFSIMFPIVFENLLGKSPVDVSVQCQLETDYTCKCPTTLASVNDPWEWLLCDYRAFLEEQKEKQKKMEEKDEGKEQEKDDHWRSGQITHAQNFYERRVVFPAYGPHPPLEFLLWIGWHREKVDAAIQCDINDEEEKIEPWATSGQEEEEPEPELQPKLEPKLEEGPSKQEGWRQPGRKQFFLSSGINEDHYAELFDWAFEHTSTSVGVQCDKSQLLQQPEICDVCGGGRRAKLWPNVWCQLRRLEENMFPDRFYHPVFYDDFYEDYSLDEGYDSP